MSCDIDFDSKQCKNNQHDSCHGSWTGLGFHILCNCPCHEVKKGATDRVCGPDSVGTNSLEGTKESDQP